MADEHFATCNWSPSSGYDAHTPYGAVPMFGEEGQRAVELMLLSAASCLDFFLVEYAEARELDVTHLGVECMGEVVPGPTRVAEIKTRVSVVGRLEEEEVNKMVAMCERACKVMNTLKQSPETHVKVSLSPMETGSDA